MLKPEAFGSILLFAFDMMEGMSSDAEDDHFSSDEEVSTMWRTSCCTRLRIILAVRLCKDSYTQKNWERWP